MPLAIAQHSHSPRTNTVCAAGSTSATAAGTYGTQTQNPSPVAHLEAYLSYAML